MPLLCIMQLTENIIGTQVVRAQGDYVVGRVGVIVDVDTEKNRAQVDWDHNPKSWVALSALEPTSIPYEIIPSYQKDRFTFTNPKYKRL